jgi:predicted phage baseplate assembly protein
VLQSLPLSWAGINAVEIDQRETIEGRVVGTSDGSADQEFPLGSGSVEPETLDIKVEETRRGLQSWLRIEDLALAGRDDAAYSLDSEAGTVRFGDGVRGRIPEAGRRVVIGVMRIGGGLAGNLPAGTLAEVAARDLAGDEVKKLKVVQPLPTSGGDDAETIEAAEQRIPARLRHRERAVTADDYRQIAAETPGVRMGRVEVLPRFKPQQRRSPVPGVVSVLVLPFASERQPPNPRPDRPFLETVHAYLDGRRPIATELYTIGCEYVPLGVSVGITIRDGFGRDTVIQEVRDALRLALWPLTPGGPAGAGWPLGRPVRDRELEVTISRVDGVDSVSPVNVFERQGKDWRMLPRADANHPVELALREWQLPELLSVVVVADAESPKDLRGVPNPFAQAGNEVAVPVVPEIC